MVSTEPGAAHTLAVDVVGLPSKNVVVSATTRRSLIAEVAPFLERRHHLFVAGRRFSVPEWARAVVSDLVVEDTLVIKDVKDRYLLVSVDQEVPTTLVVATDWGQLDMRDIEIAYLRAVT
jgi:hypothetical protein